MALFIGFLIIVGLLIWALKVAPVASIFCVLLACLLISRDNPPQTEIGWIMLATMLVGMVINLAFYRKKRSYEC